MDRVYEEKRSRLMGWNEWPLELNEYADLVGVNRRFVVRAVVDRGMVPMKKRKDGREIPVVFGAFVTRDYGLEIWEWLYAHLERRAYDATSNSRKVAGMPACSWLPRWVPPPAGKADALPPEVEAHFNEDRRYRGKELAEWLGVSTYRVSRIAVRMKYRGGWYLIEEARRIAAAILRDKTIHFTTASMSTGSAL